MFKDFLYRHVTAIDILAAIIILVLVMSNIYFVLQSHQLRVELDKERYGEEVKGHNEAVIDFLDLFVDDVLRAEGEIDFETRLQLESSVRALEDEEILVRWQAFTSAQSEKEAQTAVKELLGILSQRIKDGI